MPQASLAGTDDGFFAVGYPWLMEDALETRLATVLVLEDRRRVSSAFEAARVISCSISRSLRSGWGRPPAVRQGGDEEVDQAGADTGAEDWLHATHDVAQSRLGRRPDLPSYNSRNHAMPPNIKQMSTSSRNVNLSRLLQVGLSA